MAPRRSVTMFFLESQAPGGLIIAGFRDLAKGESPKRANFAAL
jgi:hypothetical protein